MSTRITTGIARASYLHAVTPRKMEGSDTPKYGVQLLIPKEDTKTVKMIKEAIAEAVKADREGNNKLKGVTTPRTTFHDGDGEKVNGGAYGEECKGCWVLSTSSLTKPQLVDRNIAPLPDEAEWYSGIYVRANVNFYAYNTSGNKGIACGLNHLMKWRDGEPLSGAGSAVDAFDDGFEDEESVLD